MTYKFKSEAGCPVDIVSARTSLEIDPIGAPMACRIYVDYKNISNKSLAGVKFRIGYIDSEDKVRGTFHAADGQSLSPASVAKAKWRGDKVDPRTASVMIRVLVARFSDGSLWESEKMKELAPGTGGAGSSVTSASGDASASSASSSSSSMPAQGAASGNESPAAQASPGSAPAGSDKSSDGY
ncbi:MAG: hypothetical protein K2X27_25905 [Candidatus Obscuribacterales bacterium]|nr:hypothetical protein [Candidatus Obscuribacterales bacterium]